MASSLIRSDLIYPELSYEVIGASFAVYNNLGWGHREVYYQRALAEELKARKIPFIREQSVKIAYGNTSIGRYVLDFVVDDKLVFELKISPRLGYTHIKQTQSYLAALHLPLAILIYFTKDGVKYRRVLAVQKS